MRTAKNPAGEENPVTVGLGRNEDGVDYLLVYVRGELLFTTPNIAQGWCWADELEQHMQEKADELVASPWWTWWAGFSNN